MNILTANEQKLLEIENNIKNLKVIRDEKTVELKDKETAVAIELREKEAAVRETQIAIDYLVMARDIFQGENATDNGQPSHGKAIKQNDDKPNREGGKYQEGGIAWTAERVLLKTRKPMALKSLKEGCNFPKGHASSFGVVISAENRKGNTFCSLAKGIYGLIALVDTYKALHEYPEFAHKFKK